MSDSLQTLQRYSTPAKMLNEPAPDDAQLKQILQVAMSAPDHGRLYPYRFIAIRGDARYKLSDIFGEAIARRDPDVHPAYIKKQRDKPLRSPLIVVVVARPTENPKVPEIEQLHSAGAAAHGILLAANALGFGSIWLTGDNAYDPFVCEELGLDENERIVAFIYLGTPAVELPPREHPAVEDFLSHWE